MEAISPRINKSAGGAVVGALRKNVIFCCKHFHRELSACALVATVTQGQQNTVVKYWPPQISEFFI